MRVEHMAHTWSQSGPKVVLHQVTVRADEPGPSVVVCANVHGDETVGTGAVLLLMEALQRDLQRGSVTVFPSINPRGLVERTRPFGKDGQDLNRVFPGDSSGTPASRYVAWVWGHITSASPTALVDLHADSYDAVPYAIVDRPVNHSGSAKRRIGEQMAAMADAAGVLVLQDYAERDYVRFGLDRSLAGAVVNRLGVPALTLECGPRGALAPEAERQTVQAVLRVLAHLGCVADQPAVNGVARGPWRRRSGPRVRFEGILRPLVRPGAEYAHGDVLARVRALSGDVLEELRAAHPGLLVAWANESWIRPGQSVATVASKESS